MTRAGFPYVKPGANLVRADVWMLRQGNEIYEAPVYLPAWDYDTTLNFHREVQVDVKEITSASRLSLSTKLKLAVSAFSTATWVRSPVFGVGLSESSQRVVIEFQLGGEELGASLRLHTSLLLERSSDQRPFSAHVPGSILWRDTFEIKLQGDAPLFPISVVDFERAGFADGAGWYLHLGPDLEAPLHASIRLYVNSSASSVVTAFRNAGAPRPEDRVLLRAVRSDVARVMVEYSLLQDELLSDREWGSDSLGFALRSLLDRYYPGEDLRQVGKRRLNHPADFSAELFAKLRVFDDA